MNTSKHLRLPATSLFISIAVLCSISIDGIAQKLNIKNDVFWNDKDGNPIYSQGGGIFKFPNPNTGKTKYYWYGVRYKEADVYRNNPAVTLKRATFESVACYSSDDLVNWKFEAEVLTPDALKERAYWVGRLGVAYLKEMEKYVLVVQFNKEVLFAVSDTPTGKFSWHQKISMQEMIGTTNTGDQTVFTDEDTGKSYLVYSYGSGRNKIYISEIGVKEGMAGLLDCTEIFRGESREGNCMFKYNGKYYMAASNIYGWDSSYAYYLVADSIRGLYMPQNDMQIMDGCADDYAHVTQTGFFFSVKGSKQETIVYCGDRWADFAGNGLGYNHWFPMSFEGAKPVFNSVSSWNLDAGTGEWEVANDNNYVKNGSFEADRKLIPSTVKPVQLQLTGWKSDVLKGTKISLDSLSPALNYFNTEDDRKHVVGEKSLNITDQIDFKRKVSQTIASTPYIKLPDGLYSLTAQVKYSDGFTRLELYAESDGRKQKLTMDGRQDTWTKIRIDNIRVRGDKVEVGFNAEGKANAFCHIDDIALVKAPVKVK